MAEYVLKPDRDTDRYIGWTTVAEGMTWVGTRDDALRFFAGRTPAGFAPIPGNTPEDRLAHVDLHGTSALWPGPTEFYGGWNDDGLIVEQRGFLDRSDLPAFVDAMEADDETAAYALLRAFDDETEETP